MVFRPATASDLPDLTPLVAAAFQLSPLWAWAEPSPGARRILLGRWAFSVLDHYLAKGHVLTGDGHEAVMWWHHNDDEEAFAAEHAGIIVATCSTPAAKPLLEAAAKTAAARPSGRYANLAGIAAWPQRHGHASALLNFAHREVFGPQGMSGDQGLPVFTTTTDLGVLRLFHRHRYVDSAGITLSAMHGLIAYPLLRAPTPAIAGRPK